MIQHPDGRLEGTPEELSAYSKLQTAQHPTKFIDPAGTGVNPMIPWIMTKTTGVDKGKYPGDDIRPYAIDKTKNPYDRPRPMWSSDIMPGTHVTIDMSVPQHNMGIS